MTILKSLTKYLSGDEGSPKKINAAVGCNIGRHRENNEDNFYFRGKMLNPENRGLDQILTDKTDFPGSKEETWLFYGVFDGVGGGSYGELASAAAANTARKRIYEKGYFNFYDITPSLDKLFREMNLEVVHTAQNLGASQMGSTMVSLFFYGGYVWVSNLGDSPGFLLRDGNLQKLTRDHTDEAMMKANGITGRKPYLTQYLGVDPEQMRISPTITCHEPVIGDRFLLCSDGLTDMIPPDQIQKIMNSVRKASNCANELIKAALDAGGRDNITVIICDME